MEGRGVQEYHGWPSDVSGRIVTARATTHPVVTVCALLGFVIVASAVMNNTPVVAVMIPILIAIFLIGLRPAPFFATMDASVNQLVEEKLELAIPQEATESTAATDQTVVDSDS